MALVPDKRTNRNVEKLIEDMTKVPGQWVYMARAKHSQNVRNHIVDEAKNILTMMGLKVEVDPYHSCRVRIAP